MSPDTEAGAGLEVLRDLRPGDIRKAAKAARGMGRIFVAQVKAGAALLDDDNRAFLLPLLQGKER